MIELIEPLSVDVDVRVRCPCGAKAGGPRADIIHLEEIWGMPGYEKITQEASLGVDCHYCHRTFRLICRVEAEK
jgi:hypothetical protein